MYPKGNFKNHCLSLTFLKEFSEEQEDYNRREITRQTKSKEISDIISERLLENIQKQLAL
jgi:hypothetical protein